MTNNNNFPKTYGVQCWVCSVDGHRIKKGVWYNIIVNDDDEEQTFFESFDSAAEADVEQI